jgi:hypothetical protein
MEPQQQQSLDEFKAALQKIAEGWTLIKSQDQPVRNIIYTATNTSLLSMPADMPEHMAEVSRYCHEALAHLGRLGL